MIFKPPAIERKTSDVYNLTFALFSKTAKSKENRFGSNPDVFRTGLENGDEETRA
ncbi:Uncharacterised protein [Chlamydia trachomatis]|nr:Uncharacterised protein [Chlamydia trachomatis]